jgi:hypothetical protein
MAQHPKLTIGWALDGLETAISNLPNGAIEARVRAQFHQLLLALERGHFLTDLEKLQTLFDRDVHQELESEPAPSGFEGDVTFVTSSQTPR